MYLITNRTLCTEDEYFKRINEACVNGVDNVIIREKDLSDECVKKIYEKISEMLPKDIRKKTSIMINSKIKVYENSYCDGIHLPYWLFKEKLEEGYIFNSNKKIGLSLHSTDEIVEMEKIRKNYNIKISYITLSHIYETKCKQGLKPKGLELLKNSGNLTKVKRVALGGIDSSNIKQTLKYCDDVAVMSLIMKSDNVKNTLDKLLDYD